MCPPAVQFVIVLMSQQESQAAVLCKKCSTVGYTEYNAVIGIFYVLAAGIYCSCCLHASMCAEPMGL